MKLFSEKVKPTSTNSSLNIIQVENFEEIFFGVYEIEINKTKYLAEKVSEYNGNPVVSVPVEVEGEQIFYPFVLTKGKQEIVFNENNFEWNDDVILEQHPVTVAPEPEPELIEEEVEETVDFSKIISEQEKHEKVKKEINRAKVQHQQDVNDNLKKGVNRALSRVGQLNNKVDELTLAISEEIEAKLQQAEKNIVQYYTNKLKMLEEKTFDITDETRKYLTELVNDSKSDLVNEVRDIRNGEIVEYVVEANGKKSKVDFDSIKKDLDKKINTKIDSEVTRLRKYIAVYSGGGSVAAQFADGGTMNGNLTVNGDLVVTGSTVLNSLSANSFSTDNFVTVNLSAENIVAGSITTDLLSANSIITDNFTTNNFATNNLSANNIVAGTIITDSLFTNNIVTDSLSVIDLFAENITVDTLSANEVIIDNLFANNVIIDSLSVIDIQAETITVSTLSSTDIVTDTIFTDVLSSNSILTQSISTNFLYALSSVTHVIDITIAELSGFDITGDVTIIGNLSTTGVIFASGGNSNEWNDVYNTVQATSGNYVPYVGATQDVNLGTHSLSTSNLLVKPANGYSILNGHTLVLSNSNDINNGFRATISHGGNESIIFGAYNTFLMNMSYGDFSPNIQINRDHSFGWSTSTSGPSQGDLKLFRDAPNTLAQRNGINSQTLRVYNTYTDSSNYERGVVRWEDNTLSIGTEKSGTGQTRAMILNAGNSSLAFNYNGALNLGESTELSNSGDSARFVGSFFNTTPFKLANNRMIAWTNANAAYYPPVVGIGLNSPEGLEVNSSVLGQYRDLTVRNLSATNVIYASGGNSNKWNEAYDNTIAISAGYVPYTGATNDVDLGVFKLSAKNTSLYPSVNEIGLIINNDGASNNNKAILVNNDEHGNILSIGEYDGVGVKISPGGSNWLTVGNDSSYFSNGPTNSHLFFGNNSTGIKFSPNYNYNIDTTLVRDDVGTLAQVNGLNPQSFRVYNTFTDSSNYERGFFKWDSNVLKIGADAAGTGQARSLEVYGEGIRDAKFGYNFVNLTHTYPFADLGSDLGLPIQRWNRFNSANISDNGSLVGIGTTSPTSKLHVSDTWNNSLSSFTASLVNVTDTASNANSLLADWQVNGVSKVKITKGTNDGASIILGSTGGPLTIQTAGNRALIGGNHNIELAENFRVYRAGENNGAVQIGPYSSDSPMLFSESNHTLSQRNNANPQTFRVYNTSTDSSNYERGSFKWESNVLKIRAEHSGTGQPRDIQISSHITKIDGNGGEVILQTGGADRWKISNNNWVPCADNFYDLGQQAFRVKDGYFAGNIYANNLVTSISGSNINNTNFPTTSAVYDFVNESVIHAGAVSQPSYIDNLDGSITLSDGYYSFASDTVGSPPYQTFLIPSQVVNLVDEQLNYVVANYNNGAPFITSVITNDTIDNSVIYPVFAIARHDTELRSISLKQEALGLPNKTLLRIQRTHPTEPELGGMMIGTYGANRAVTVTGGKVWFGSSYNTYAPTDSQAGTEMRFWRHNGPGVWIYNVDDQFNNEAWDNGNFLVELTNNRYAVSYVWRSLGEGVDILHFIVGTGDYTLAQAQEAPIPTDIPSLLESSIFVGRIIIQKFQSIPYQVDSPFGTKLSFSAVTDHEGLANLQGGATGEHYHLTLAELTKLQDLSGGGGGGLSGDFVPYTGADKGVDLGANNLSAGKIVSNLIDTTFGQNLLISGGGGSTDGHIVIRAGQGYANVGVQAGQLLMLDLIGTRVAAFGQNGIELISNAGISWSQNSGGPSDQNKDLFVLRDSANTLAQRNSTNPQTFRFYQTFTDASNYARGSVTSNTNVTLGSYVQLASESAGTGSTDIDLVISPKGTGAFVVGPLPDGTTAGGNARGSNAVDLQMSRTGAARVASGTRSTIVGGNDNLASGSNSIVAGGFTNAASGATSTIIGGSNNTATTTNAGAIGTALSIADGIGSIVLGGRGGRTRGGTGRLVKPASWEPIGNSGQNQASELIVARETTDATPIILRSDNGAVSTANQLSLPANSFYTVKGTAVAGMTGAGSTKGWEFSMVIKKGATNATTAFVGTPNIIVVGEDAGATTWTLTFVADTTMGVLQAIFTGENGKTIRCVVHFNSVEGTF